MSVDRFKFISPGIFVNEIDNTGKTAIPTDVGPVIIGRAQKGPILQPIRVNSYFDFVNIFGAPLPGGQGGDVARDGNYTSPTYGAYAAQAWFRNNAPVTFVRLGGQDHNKATDDGGISLAGWQTTKLDPDTTMADNGGAWGLFVADAPAVSEFLSGTITVATVPVVAGQTIVLDDGRGTTRTITSGSSTTATTFDASTGVKATIAEEIRDAINAGSMFTAAISASTDTVTLEVNSSVSPLDDVPTLYQGPSIKESGGAATQATATCIFDAGGFPFMVAGVSGAITIVDASGVSMVLTLDNGTATSAAGVIGGDGAATDAVFAQRFAQAVNATTGDVTASPTDGSSATITLTQDTAGSAGNKTNTNPAGNTDVELANFDGGSDGPSALVAVIEGMDADLANNVAGVCSASYAAVTGTLAATWYIDQNAVIGLSGTVSETGDNGIGTSAYFDSVSSQQFKVQISGSSGIAVDSTFDFSPNSENFIRKVFNTNPILTNSDAVDDTSNSFSRYWLGESYEGAVKEKVSSTGNQIGVILPLVSGSAPDLSGGKFRKAHQRAKTGYFFSQDLATGESATGSYSAADQQNLFRLASRDSGEWLQKELKVSIKDLKASSMDSADPYGSFSVVLRRMNDTDNRVEIVEQFNNCNLNPSSKNFILRKIGNQRQEWDEEERRYKTHGDYINASNYIWVDMPSEVEKGDTDPRYLPFGVRGPLRFNSFTDNTGSALRNTIVSGSWDSYDDGFIPEVFISGNEVTDGKVLFEFPKLRMRVSASDGSPVDSRNSYFGVDTTFTSDGTQLNRSVLDHLKIKPGTPNSIDDFVAGINTSISYNFTLDDMCVTSSNLYVYKEDSRANTGSRDGLDYLRGSGSYTEILDSPVKIDRFTTVFHGGSNGLDIKESEPARIVQPEAGTSDDVTQNYMFNSFQVAIDSIRDPEKIEYNLATMPGIKNTVLNQTLINMCQSRGDSLAIVDLKGGFQPQYESTSDEDARRGSVAKVVAEAKNILIDSSYGATYYPWVQIRDTNNGKPVWVPPSVVALGAMSYGQKSSALWFAPAGFTRGGLSVGRAGLPVVAVRDRLTSRDRDELYDNRINPIAQFPAEGIVIFGQKTLQATPSALDRINVRRLMIFLKRQISRYAATILFDQNVRVTWNRFKGQVEPFLRGVQAGLGITEFKLVLDETTTTPDLVDRNIMYAKIYIKPARAIEYIAIDFILTDSGAAFDD